MQDEPSVSAVPPFSIETEACLLGAVMAFPEMIEVCEEAITTPDMFYRTSHRDAWNAIKRLHAASESYDWSSVFHEMVAHDCPADVAYLRRLTDETMPLTDNVADWARVIVDKYRRRTLIRVCTELRAEAYDPTVSTDEAMATAQKVLADLDGGGRLGIAITDAVDSAVARINEVAGTRKLSGWSTGHPGIDYRTLGYFPGEVSLLAGRTGDGKTFTGWTLAVQFIRANKIPAGVIGLEMDAPEMIDRQVVTDVTWRMAIDPAVSNDDFRKIADEAIARLESYREVPLYITTPKNFRIEEIERCIRWHARQGCKLIVLDYIGLVAAMPKLGPVEVAEHHIRALKQAARTAGCALMVLSQVNRENMHGSIMDFGAHHVYGHAGAHVSNAAHRISIPIRVAHHLNDTKVAAFVDYMGAHERRAAAERMTLHRFVKGRRGESRHWQAWIGDGDDTVMVPVMGELAKLVEDACKSAMKGEG